MEWLQSINREIKYIEDNLCEDIGLEDAARAAYSSSSHFSRIFNIVTGITIGEYIRNGRLSCAGRDLQKTDEKVIDVALKYRYDTPESFSKAFAADFHLRNGDFYCGKTENSKQIRCRYICDF